MSEHFDGEEYAAGLKIGFEVARRGDDDRLCAGVHRDFRSGFEAGYASYFIDGDAEMVRAEERFGC